MAAVPTCVSSAWPEARSGVRNPCSSTRSTADSTAAAASSISSEWRSISATDPNVASGFAIPWPAMSGAEPCTGSYRPGPSAPRLARRKQPDRARDHRGLVGEDVAEHVLGEEDVEVGGARDQLHGGVVDGGLRNRGFTIN